MRKSLPLFVLIFLLVTSIFLTMRRADAQSDAGSLNTGARKAVDDFNRRFVENCRNMNNKAGAEMWAEDGVDLLPGMDPMVGKAAISKWLAGLEEQSKGAKVTQCDVD